MRIRCGTGAIVGLGVLVVLMVLLPRPGLGQTMTSTNEAEPEAFGSVGWGHLARAEDRTFGDEVSLGGGIGVVLRRHLGIEIEVNRMFGLTATAGSCGLAACVGVSREGVTSALILSGNVRYLFGEGRVQPHVGGGAGGMWTRSFVSQVIVQSGIGTLTEVARRDAGLALNVGGGVAIALNRMVSLRPEVRVYDSSVQSRQNLYLVRTSVATAVRW
jgi:hypothetical protein